MASVTEGPNDLHEGQWQNRIVGQGFVEAADLTDNPANWRLHPKGQLEALAGALGEIGWVQRVVVNKRTGHILDGHARVELARQQGAKVPVVYVDLSPNEERVMLAALDPLAGMAEEDPEKWAALLAQIEVEDSALRALLAQDDPKDGLRDPDEVPDASGAPVARRGDIWTLGEHRLMCGDATRLEDVRALFRAGIPESVQAEKAAMLFTDPPYGIAYEAEGHDAIENDDLVRDDLAQFLAAAFRNAASALASEAALYVWHAGQTRDDFIHALEGAGFQELQTIIWVKPSLVLGRSHYQWQHEPCIYASRAGEKPAFYADRSESTAWHIQDATDTQGTSWVLGNGLILTDGHGNEMFITPKVPKGKKVRTMRLGEGQRAALLRDVESTDTWEVSRDEHRPQHPTQKPVELAQRAMRNSTKRGDIVLDLFLGSGTTLIAAERLDRRCYGMEISPKYVDLAVKRWEEFTGRSAVRASAASTNGTTPTAPSTSSRPTRASTGKTKAPVS